MQDTLRSKNVLVVEDDQITQQVFVHTIRRLGYGAVGATTGQEAVDHSASSHPDLVFMDLNLPDMTGAVAAQHIRRLPGLRDLPMVAITVSADSDAHEAALSAGCKDIISKPINAAQLKALLARWLPL